MFVADSRPRPGCLLRQPGSGPVAGEPVAKDLAFLQIDNGLSDLGGVVGDPLDVSRCVDQTEPRVDAFGMRDDVLLQQLEHRAVMAVYPSLGGHDGLSLADVGLDQGVKTVMDLVEGFQSQVFERLGDGGTPGDQSRVS